MNRIFLFGILLIAAGVVAALLTFPAYQKFKEQTAKVAQLDQELKNQERYFADLREIQSMLRESPGKLAKIEAAIPTDKQLPALYEFLQAKAAGAGLVLRGISSSAPEQGKGPLQTVPVNLELTGSYEAFKAFVGQVHSASRLMNVQALEVSGSQDPGAFTILVELNAYSY